MIREVRSDLRHFRTARFQGAENIVLADTAADASENESTNGLGKTTLIRIIHFCFGANIARDQVLNHPALEGVSFGLTFVHQRAKYLVDRRIGEKTVLISSSFVDGTNAEVIAKDGEQVRISLEDWVMVLAQRLLPETYDPARMEYAPGFREVFRYQARLGKDAYIDPMQAFKGQPGPSKRLVTAYLLALNWDQQRKLQEEQKKRDQVSTAIKALEEAESAADEKSIGDLEAERVVLDRMIRQRREEVANFNVRQDYADLEGRLNVVDRQIHDLVNDNHSDERLLEYYSRSAEETPSHSVDAPLQILADAGAIFKDEALRDIEEVAQFHRQIYRNRHDFLATEIGRLNSLIANRRKRIDELADEKSNVLRVLRSSGALESLIELQRGLTDLESQHDSLRARIDERKRFDQRKDVLSTSMIEGRALLKRDLDDRRASVDEAVGLFAEYTKFLYGVPGKLSIDVKQAGYSFGISIDREGSDGVDQMVVFCFDLAIATIRARRNTEFNVLIHDSTMFADVDPRQYGLALQLAVATSKQEGFQYICCLNTGALPKDHLGDFDIDGAVRLRLTDDGDRGRLLGMRLPPRDVA